MALGQCQAWNPSLCPAPGVPGASLGSALLLLVWGLDQGSRLPPEQHPDTPPQGGAEAGTPPGKGALPQQIWGLSPFDEGFFPALESIRDPSTPPQLSAPQGDPAPPAVEQRQLQGTQGHLPKPVADSSKAFPIPTVGAGTEAGLGRGAISFCTAWHGSTQRARREASTALSWGVLGSFPPTAADAETPPPPLPTTLPKTCPGLILPSPCSFPRLCRGSWRSSRFPAALSCAWEGTVLRSQRSLKAQGSPGSPRIPQTAAAWQEVWWGLLRAASRQGCADGVCGDDLCLSL